MLREKHPIRIWDDVTLSGTWVHRRIFPNGDMEESFDQGWTWKQWTPININPWHATYPRIVPIENHWRRNMEKLACPHVPWAHSSKATKSSPSSYKPGTEPLRPNFTKGKPWEKHTSEHGKIPKKSYKDKSLETTQVPDSIVLNNGIVMKRLPNQKGHNVSFGLNPNKRR
ncbi:hypothetical protein F5887DRAFT_1081651 [Amanita rubescens]|nr:hypothetical protein F5887DRAFT_1081651 [Amanita rubescens]